MNEIEKIEEERFVESLMYLWIAQDAPDWIKDYVRMELMKQRGLLKEKDMKAIEKVNGMDNQSIAKIIEVLFDVAERTEMSKDEEEYYDMAIGLISIMSEEQKQSRRIPYSHGSNVQWT